MQHRPKALNKLVVHQDIGEHLSKLVGMHSHIFSGQGRPSGNTTPCVVRLLTIR